MPLSELAISYALNTELLLSILGPRTGTGKAVQGHLEGGLLYTPAFLRSVKAQLRGGLRGATTPLALGTLVKTLGLSEGIGGAGGGGGGMLASLAEGLVGDGDVRGVLRPGGSAWVPAVFTAAQTGAVRGFYEANGWVGYDVVRRAGITNDRVYLKGAFPGGMDLDSGGWGCEDWVVWGGDCHGGHVPDGVFRPLQFSLGRSMHASLGATKERFA